MEPSVNLSHENIEGDDFNTVVGSVLVVLVSIQDALVFIQEHGTIPKRMMISKTVSRVTITWR